MKINAVSHLAALALATVLAMPAMAAEGRITVTGHGQVAAVPDMATINLGVFTQARTAAQALSENNAATAASLAVLTAAGLAARDMQTTGLTLNPTWDARDGESARISGYVANNDITLRVRDLDALGGILDRVVAGGANNFNGLTFGVSAPEPLLDAARAAAVKDARRKAALMADAAGVTLGPIIEITETLQMAGPMPMFRAEMAADAVPLVAGEVGMGADVTIIYAIGQ